MRRPASAAISRTDTAAKPRSAKRRSAASRMMSRVVGASDLAAARRGLMRRRRVGGDPALIARYRAGGAYHPYHPFWLFNENEYAMTTAARIIMAGATPGEHWDQLGCVVTPDFAAAWNQALALVGPRPRTLVLPTYWSKPRIKVRTKGEGI